MAVQGAYFLLIGLWPLFGIISFQAVTGPRTDLWLAYTVGCLVAVIGATLVVATVRGQITAEVIVLAVGSAAALAGIDVVFVLRGVISWVYLLDALAEGGFIAWWALSYAGPPPPADRQYVYVHRLLNRGRSATPAANAPRHPLG
jgi:hypothetical protein